MKKYYLMLTVICLFFNLFIIHSTQAEIAQYGDRIVAECKEEGRAHPVVCSKGIVCRPESYSMEPGTPGTRLKSGEKLIWKYYNEIDSRYPISETVGKPCTIGNIKGVCGDDGECHYPLSHSMKKCYDNNVYWYNSRNEKEELLETCAGTCIDGKCAVKTCESYEISVNDECVKLIDWCGNDSILKYDTETKKCYCPDGYVYNNRRCEAQKTDCLNTEILIDNKCMKIKELCGNDTKIQYDVKTQQCYCPTEYELKTEGNQKICQATSEISVIVKVDNDSPQPPLLADGKTETKFLIYAKDKATGKNVDLTFEIGYSRTEKKGQITNFSGNNNGYTITYRTANLGEIEGQPIDYLYIYYNTADKKERESYAIELYTQTESQMSVSHLGFENVTVPLAFKGPKTKVFVYTIVNEHKIPINNAKILYENDWVTHTDKNGSAILKTRKTVYGTEETQQEVELKITPQMNEWVDEAKTQYKKLGLFNDLITDFLTNFTKHLAETETEKETTQQMSALKNLKYNLLFINKGDRFAEGTADMIGGTTGDLLCDLYEFIANLTDLSGKLQKIIKEAPASSFNLSDSKHKLLQELIKLLPKDTEQAFRKKVAKEILWNAPRLNHKIVDSLLSELFSQALNESLKSEINSLKVQKLVADYMYRGHREFDESVVRKIATKFIKKDFEQYEYITEAKISLAESQYDQFVTNYQFKNEMEFNATFVKDLSDLLRGTVLKGVQIAVPTTNKIIGTIDKVADGLDLAFQGTRLTLWYKAFGENQDMVAKSTAELMDINLGFDVNNEKFYRYAIDEYFTQSAYAKTDENEMDLLKIMYENEINSDNPDRKIVFDYIQSRTDLELKQKLEKIMDIVNEMDPQNNESQKIIDKINSELTALQKEIEENENKISNLDILKPKTKSSYRKTRLFTLFSLVTLLSMLAVVIFVWIRSKGKIIMFRILLVIGTIIVLIFIFGWLFNYLNKMNTKEIDSIIVNYKIPEVLE